MMKGKPAPLVGIICVFLVIFGSLWYCFPPFSLIFADGESDQVFRTIPVEAGDSFSIVFIHSVHRTPVTDYFYIDGEGTIILYKTTFDTYGVGMPYETDHHFYIEGHLFVIDEINEPFATLPYRVASFTEHVLTIGETRIPFDSMATTGTLLSIQVQPFSLTTLWRKVR